MRDLQGIDSARAAGEIDGLMVVAAPRFLGLLRQRLDPTTHKIVAFELDRDLTRLGAEEIRTHLPERLEGEG
jgi:protein required for attachment to host cells